MFVNKVEIRREIQIALNLTEVLFRLIIFQLCLQTTFQLLTRSKNARNSNWTHKTSWPHQIIKFRNSTIIFLQALYIFGENFGKSSTVSFSQWILDDINLHHHKAKISIEVKYYWGSKEIGLYLENVI